MGEEKENKVWLGEDGIIYAEVVKVDSEEDAYEILEGIKKILKKSSRKMKIFIDIMTSTIIASSQFRKECGEKIKELYEDIGFERTAICGITVIPRTIAFFVIKASGVKNIEIFKTKKEALKWLKEP